MKNKRVDSVVDRGLCTSCGICAGACHKGSIAFHYGKERNIPVINDDTCVSCAACYDVCPGKGLLVNELSGSIFSNESGIKKNDYAGFYSHAYVGHSTDENIRFHSATGGMVSQFLMWLLQKGVIEGAVVVRYNHDNPMLPEPFIAKTKDEIWEARSSKYVVLSMDRVAKEIAESRHKKLVVVGLPCQIQGWRMLAKKNKNVRDSIIGFFSIYCSINKTKASMDYYPKRYHVDTREVGRFSFRDDGCLGFMKFENKQGEVMKKIPYHSFWFGTHSFFINPRCLMCIDQLGELADLSFGDIHIEPYSNDKIGTNSIIARSENWNRLLVQCKSDGAIALDEVQIESVIRSQSYVKIYKKGAGAKAYMIIRRWLGKAVPLYDYEYKGKIGLSCFISSFIKSMMVKVGKYPQLWYIIKMFDKHKEV